MRTKTEWCPSCSFMQYPGHWCPAAAERLPAPAARSSPLITVDELEEIASAGSKLYSSEPPTFRGASEPTTLGPRSHNWNREIGACLNCGADISTEEGCPAVDGPNGSPMWALVVDRLIERKIAARASLGVERPPRPLCFVPMSMDSVAGGAVATMVTQPQVAFRPRHLTIAPEIASSFRVLDILNGRVSSVASWNACGMPATAFAPPGHSVKEWPDGFGNLTGLPVVFCAEVFALVVQNISPAALRFSAVVFAEPVQPSPPPRQPVGCGT